MQAMDMQNIGEQKPAWWKRITLAAFVLGLLVAGIWFVAKRPAKQAPAPPDSMASMGAMTMPATSSPGEASGASTELQIDLASDDLKKAQIRTARVTTGVTAGIEQWQGDFPGYGQGFSGYAKRYGATYGDRITSTFFGAALLPSLLHQDPRYFYRGKGHVVTRALYAISTVVICKGDNGHWQPNYSSVLGSLAAGGLSNLYSPASSRNGVGLTFENTLVGIGGSAMSAVVEEFFSKKLTPHARDQRAPEVPVGTR